MPFPVEGSGASLMGEPHILRGPLVLDLAACLLKAPPGNMAGNGQGRRSENREEVEQSPGKRLQMLKQKGEARIELGS